MTIWILALLLLPSMLNDNIHMHNNLPYVFLHAIYAMHNKDNKQVQ
jgi:hypothetical protein